MIECGHGWSRPTAGTRALLATAEHSVLGARYIYDGEADPLYLAQLLRIINTNLSEFRFESDSSASWRHRSHHLTTRMWLDC